MSRSRKFVVLGSAAAALVVLCAGLAWVRLGQASPDIVRDAERVSVAGYQRTSARLDNESLDLAYWHDLGLVVPNLSPISDISGPTTPRSARGRAPPLVCAACGI